MKKDMVRKGEGGREGEMDWVGDLGYSGVISDTKGRRGEWRDKVGNVEWGDTWVEAKDRFKE